MIIEIVIVIIVALCLLCTNVENLVGGYLTQSDYGSHSRNRCGLTSTLNMMANTDGYLHKIICTNIRYIARTLNSEKDRAFFWNMCARYVCGDKREMVRSDKPLDVSRDGNLSFRLMPQMRDSGKGINPFTILWIMLVSKKDIFNKDPFVYFGYDPKLGVQNKGFKSFEIMNYETDKPTKYSLCIYNGFMSEFNLSNIFYHATPVIECGIMGYKTDTGGHVIAFVQKGNEVLVINDTKNNEPYLLDHIPVVPYSNLLIVIMETYYVPQFEKNLYRQIARECLKMK